MKWNQIIFTSLILLVPLICFSQKSSDAILVDEFDTTPNCEDRLARIDNFFQGLLQSPEYKGYIVIYGTGDNQLEKYKIEADLKDAVRTRGYDINQITFIQGKDTEKTKIQFWRVPIDANKPNFIKQQWDYSLSKINKPFILYQQSWTDYGICSSIYSEDLFFKFLAANPSLRGHIVIRSKSNKNYPKLKLNVEMDLVKNHNVPIRRLKFFYAKQIDFPDVEYWLVPSSKK